MKKIVMAALAAVLLAGAAQADSPGAKGGPGTKGCQKVEDGQWCAVAGCLKISRVMYLSEDPVAGAPNASIRFDVKNSCAGAVDFGYRIGFGGAPTIIAASLVEAKQTLRLPVSVRRPDGVDKPLMHLAITPYGNSRDYNPKVPEDSQAAVSSAKLRLPLLPMKIR